MCIIGISLALTLAAAVAVAQDPAKMKAYASSSDVAAMIAKAKAERKPDQPVFAQSIVQLAPYNASLEYRGTVGPAAVHETDGDAPVRLGEDLRWHVA